MQHHRRCLRMTCQHACMHPQMASTPSRCKSLYRRAGYSPPACLSKPELTHGTATQHQHSSKVEQQPPSTPLVTALLERGARDQDAPFHVPGHKKGQGVGQAFRQLLDNGMLKHDLTEITGLDYLAAPTGAILEAQQLAAQAFQADQTWFLVNGSSGGIHAAVMAVTQPGDTLLVARNCHQAAFAAMTLAGCEPWWVQPVVDHEQGVAHTVTPAALHAALQDARARGRRVTAALVVSPTYFGSCADVQGLSHVCSAAGIPLIVDEAHGAHFGLHPALPASAMQQGADVAIQSTHKVLSAMTQASMLHIQGPRVQPARISRALQMLQSSSPSYILLSSLDAARAYAEQPELCFEEALRAAEVATQGLATVPGISLLQNQQMPSSGWDPLRLTVCVSGLGMTGYQAAEVLEMQHSVIAELSTQQVIVFAMGPGSTLMHAQQLVSAFKCLSQQALEAGWPAKNLGVPRHQQPALNNRSQQPQSVLTPRDAFFATSERVPLAAAVGRVSCELLCPYPPGVPLVYPGEVVAQEAVDVLIGTLKAGGKVTGASDSTLASLLVASL